MGRRAFVRQQILEAAFDLIARRGYEAVSTREIATAAKVGPTSMYRHFSTKEELGRELYRTALPPVHALVQAAEQELAQPGVGNLVAGLIHGLYRCYDERPRALALLVFPPHDFLPEELDPERPETLRGRLRRELADDELSAIVWGAITGPLIDRYLHHRAGRMQPLSAQHTRLVLRLLPS